MKTKRHNFTLVEMLIVLIIALILAGMILAANVVVQKKAEIAKAKATISKIESALASYYQDYGDYPAMGNGGISMNDLKLLKDPNNKLYVNWEDDEGMTDAKDPWGNEYIFSNPGAMNKESYDIYSKGPDGNFGGTNYDDSDDITTWKD